MISFWCKICSLDLDLEAEKVSVMGDEYFRAKCKRGHKLVRYITTKSDDPYYHLSKKMRIQRQQFSKDLIQPGQEGFQLIYKKEWDKLEKAREELERKEIAKKKSRDEFYKKYAASGTGNRENVKRVLELEEQYGRTTG